MFPEMLGTGAVTPVMFGNAQSRTFPNTTGVVSAGGGALSNEDTTGNAGISGDFYLIKNYSSLYMTYTADASQISRRRIGFDASRTCDIYSSSATVQSPAIQTLIIIKV